MYKSRTRKEEIPVKVLIESNDDQVGEIMDTRPPRCYHFDLKELD